MAILQLVERFINSTGFTAITWQEILMIGIGCLLLYLAIVKKFEPLLLIPIGFGAILVNLPLTGLMDDGRPHQVFLFRHRVRGYSPLSSSLVSER